MKKQLKFIAGLILNICNGDDIIEGFEGLFKFVLMLLKFIVVLLLPLIWFLQGFYELGCYFFVYKKQLRKKDIVFLKRMTEKAHTSHFHPCWGIWLTNYLCCHYCIKLLKQTKKKEELQKE